jgi:hypothetical protein
VIDTEIGQAVGPRAVAGFGLLLLISLIALILLLAASTEAASCEGDECQGPPPAPVEVIPGTAVVNGPPNPPIRFPKERGPRGGKKKKNDSSKKRGGRPEKGGGRR